MLLVDDSYSYPHAGDGALDPPATLETSGLAVVAIDYAPLAGHGSCSQAVSWWSHGITYLNLVENGNAGQW